MWEGHFASAFARLRPRYPGDPHAAIEGAGRNHRRTPQCELLTGQHRVGFRDSAESTAAHSAAGLTKSVPFRPGKVRCRHSVAKSIMALRRPAKVCQAIKSRSGTGGERVSYCFNAHRASVYGALGERVFNPGHRRASWQPRRPRATRAITPKRCR